MSEVKQGSSVPPWLEPVLKAGLEALRIVRGTWHGRASLLLIAGGIAIISGNWWEPLLSAGWKEAFGERITFPQVSPIWGAALVLLGVGVPVWKTWVERNEAAALQRPAVAMIRHESMEGVTQPLQAAHLPEELGNADIRPFSIDQSSFYEAGILTASAAAAAVRMQTDLVSGIRRLLADKPGAEIVYHGKAHIPLVFLAGHSLSTGWPVRLYELDRHKGHWWEIDETTAGDDLGLRLERLDENSNSPNAVIRISISYPVHRSEVADALRPPHRDVHISIAEPHVDAVRTRHQIEAIAVMFRKVLDELKAEEPAPTRIHVFYSGPMSVAFCLGRQISPTIHPPVLVYNFTAKTTPKYAWALYVNGQGPADSLVISTLPASA